MKKGVPIITGIIAAIAGILLIIFLQRFFFAILTLAGIVLIFPVKDYIKKFKLFLKSFKINKPFILTLLIDALYWIAFFILATAGKMLIESKVKELTLSKVTGASFEVLQQNLAMAQQMLLYMFLIFLGLIVVNLMIYTIAKYPIWAILTKKKLNKKSFFKFFALNVLWWLLWVPLSLLLITGVKPTTIIPIVIGLISLYIYMTTKLHYTMLKTDSIKKSFAKAMESLALIPKFLPVIACAVIVYFILLGIIWIISQFTVPGMWLHAILFVLYIVWLRIFLKTFIEEFKA